MNIGYVFKVTMKTRFLKCSFSHQFPILPACVVTELSVPLLLLPIYFFVSQWLYVDSLMQVRHRKINKYVCVCVSAEAHF